MSDDGHAERALDLINAEHIQNRASRVELAKVYATLALVDAVKELTQVMIDRLPEFE